MIFSFHFIDHTSLWWLRRHHYAIAIDISSLFSRRFTLILFHFMLHSLPFNSHEHERRHFLFISFQPPIIIIFALLMPRHFAIIFNAELRRIYIFDGFHFFSRRHLHWFFASYNYDIYTTLLLLFIAGLRWCHYLPAIIIDIWRHFHYYCHGYAETLSHWYRHIDLRRHYFIIDDFIYWIVCTAIYTLLIIYIYISLLHSCIIARPYFSLLYDTLPAIDEPFLIMLIFSHFTAIFWLQPAISLRAIFATLFHFSH